MKDNYTLADGKAAIVEVSAEVAKTLADFARKDKNAARKARWRKEVSLDQMYEETGFEPTDTAADIEGAYIAKEEKETLLAAVARLSDKQRRLIALRYYEEKTESEIAGILGINQSNVHRQLETVKIALNNYFEKL
jgi:RNA polymerase sigma-B factor